MLVQAHFTEARGSRRQQTVASRPFRGSGGSALPLPLSMNSGFGMKGHALARIVRRVADDVLEDHHVVGRLTSVSKRWSISACPAVATSW